MGLQLTFCCNKTPRQHFPNGGDQTFRNYDTLITPRKIYLLKRGFKGHKKPDTADIPKKIKELRGKFTEGEKGKKRQTKTTEEDQIKAPNNKRRWRKKRGQDKKPGTNTKQEGRNAGSKDNPDQGPIQIQQDDRPTPEAFLNIDFNLSEETLRGAAS